MSTPVRNGAARAAAAEGDTFSEFAAAVVEGLSASPKTLPCKFFYDARGSDLFEAITELPEYYPTRTETAILRDRAADIVRALEPRTALIEFGSGSSRKTEILLRAGRFPVYAPIDVSHSALGEAARRLAVRFPALRVEPVIADFTGRVALPPWLREMPKTGFFPGSTIGNFAPDDARDLLAHFRALLGADARLVIGVDLRKDPARLIAAYDDARGVTAAFNRNLLARMQRELGARVDPADFAHRAAYDEAQGRIEMHLVARRAQAIEFAGRVFELAAGETIHTENSYKYSDDAFDALAHEGGWRALDVFKDAEGLFSVRVLAAR